MTTAQRRIVDQERAWHELRAERFARLSEPYSPLAQVGLFWLTESPLAFPDVPGHWYVDDGRAALLADEGDSLRRPVTAELITGTSRRSVPEGGSIVFAEFGPLTGNTKRIELIKRTGSYAIRVYDPQAPAHRAFRGVPAYPFDPDWVVPARFEEYPTPRSITVAGAQTGLEHQREAIGEAVFERDGSHHRLIIFGDHGTTILFADITSGAETAPWRLLSVQLGDSSELVLDFNRAVNLPYAFNDFGTCPQPPAENRLDLTIDAGEQAPYRPDLDHRGREDDHDRGPALSAVPRVAVGADAA